MSLNEPGDPLTRSHTLAHIGAFSTGQHPNVPPRAGLAHSFARVSIADFAQGFRSLSSLSMQMFLKDELGLEPAASQTLLSTAYLPWSCKPIYGLVSD